MTQQENVWCIKVQNIHSLQVKLLYRMHKVHYKIPVALGCPLGGKVLPWYFHLTQPGLQMLTHNFLIFYWTSL